MLQAVMGKVPTTCRVAEVATAVLGRFLGPPKSTNQHMQHAKLFHLSH